MKAAILLLIIFTFSFEFGDTASIVKMFGRNVRIHLGEVKVHLYTVDDVLEVNFNFLLTNDAFLSPNHKTLFNFTLAYPWNVQIQFKYSTSDYKSKE